MNERDETLRQFLGGYFHQDWDVNGPTWVDVVDQFLRDHGNGEITKTRDALQSWLDDTRAGTGLPSLYACDYNPRQDGLDDRTWVRAIIDHLDKRLRDPS